MRFSFISIVLFYSLFSASIGQTAEINVSENTINLSGKITPLTHQHFALKVSELLLNTPIDKNVIIELNSAGGNVSSALKIADIIRAISQYSRVITTVKANHVCASACPLILFASQNFKISDSANFIFHKPSFPQSEATLTSKQKTDLKNAAKIYTEEIARNHPILAKFLRSNDILLGKHEDVALRGWQIKKILSGTD